MIERFDFNGVKITKRNYPVSPNIPKEDQKDCFCCNKEVVNCDGTLLVSNYIAFPNILMHTECYEKWRGKETELFEDISKAYKDWIKLDNVFGSRLVSHRKEIEYEETCEHDK